MRKLKNTNISALVIILAGVAMVIYGVYRGEMTVVFAKASAICMECIGIG